MTTDNFEIGSSSGASRGVEIFPCTPSQKRMWAENKLPRQNGAPNAAMRWMVEGRLSHDTVEAALNVLVQRHEILRTDFKEINGQVMQHVWASRTLKIREIDLAFVAAEEKRERTDAIAMIEAREAIDPASAPLMRATMLRFGAEQSELLLTFHGMIIDAWSIGLLVREFRTIAEAIEAGGSYDLPVPELQFADYALWQEELLATGALNHSRAFWRRELRSAVATVVSGDRTRATEQNKDSEIRSTLLPLEFGKQLDTFVRERGVTLYATAVTALAMVLHRITGDTDIVIGSQVAGREERAAENIVGPLVNSITLRLDAEGDPALGAFLKSSSKTIQAALEHQRLPFELSIPPSSDAKEQRPLHSVNVVVQRAYSDVSDLQAADPAGFSMVALPSHSAGALWDLNFFMVGRAEGWRMSCEARTDSYSTETTDALLAGWRQSLEALVTTPDRPLSECQSLKEIPAQVGKLAGPYAKRPARRTIKILTDDPARHIVRFNPEGARTPVIALNNGFALFQLADALGRDRPFTDIHVANPDGPLEMPRRAFEDFAADAVRLIRWAQPRGPYVLSGFCVYGALAFEAARQLQQTGEEVALVSIMDSWAPGYRETMPLLNKWERTLHLRIRDYKKRLRQYKNREIGLKEIVWRPILRRFGVASPEAPNVELPAHWFDEYLRISVLSYRPKPYDGDVIIFRSQDPLRGRLFDERMGWGPLVTGRLKNVDVSAMHLEMFRGQSAREIATLMATFLAEMEGG